MIFDNVKNAKVYNSVNSKFEKAFEFIKKAVEENLEVGKYEIDGKELYASVQEYDSKTNENAKFEAHKNYIDIQYIVDGREIMGCVEISLAKEKTEYNAEKDVTFYEGSDIVSWSVAQQGDFCIFFPQDVHAPGVAYNNASSKVKKIVVKVRV